jgi:hypothetical protein
MHAKHADCAGLNDLSGPMIGYASSVLNTPGAGFLENILEIASANAMPQCPRLNLGRLRLSIERAAASLSNTSKPFACFACIRLHLR